MCAHVCVCVRVCTHVFPPCPALESFRSTRTLTKHGARVCVCAYLGYVSHKTILVGHFPYESKHTSICCCGSTECWLKLQHSLPFQGDIASKLHCEPHTPAVHRSCSSVETHVAGMMACDVCDLHVSTHRPVVFGNSSMT